VTTALYRITLRQSKKRPAVMVKLVTEASPVGAVFCAWQWVAWTNDKDRGKRKKFDLYQVESRVDGFTWNTIAEGTLADAKAQLPAQEETAPGDTRSNRILIGQQGATREHEKRSGARKARPQTRLAQMVAKMQQNR